MEFQTIRNNSVQRRGLFAKGESGHVWQNAVELERIDLRRAMEGKMGVAWLLLVLLMLFDVVGVVDVVDVV